MINAVGNNYNSYYEYLNKMKQDLKQEPLTRQKQAEAEILSPAEYAENSECDTCKNRKYQDGSNDSGVSFQNPTHIDPINSRSAVAAHENEHVVREQTKAEMENRRVIFQAVRIHTSVCEECHKVYVSGGTTTTTTANKIQQAYQPQLSQEPTFKAVA